MSRNLFEQRLRRLGDKADAGAEEHMAGAEAQFGRPEHMPAERAAGLDDVLDRVRQKLIAKVTPEELRQYRTDKAVRDRLVRLVRDLVQQEAATLGRNASASVAEQVLQDLLGYGPIQKLIDSADVSEIMVNGPASIWAEREGKLSPEPQLRFRDAEHLRQVVERIVSGVGRRIDESMPLADARLPDGSRVNAVLPPVAIDGPYLTIRKFGHRLTAEELVRRETLSREVLEALSVFVRSRMNIVVSGATGTGKTTFLNALSGFIPHDERIITIEDAAELQLQQPHVLRLETRPPNVEGKGEITIRNLVKNALRMRPDRIVVGECRGGEALDMLQAMNTGHEGSLTTLHANNPRDALRRLEVMVLMAGEDLPVRAIREQIASAVDMIVHLERLRDGTRRVTAVSQVLDIGGDGELQVEDLLRFRYDGEEEGKVQGELEPTGIKLAPVLQERARRYGLLEAIPSALR